MSAENAAVRTRVRLRRVTVAAAVALTMAAGVASPAVAAPATPAPSPTVPAPVPTATPTTVPAPTMPDPVGTKLSQTVGRTASSRVVTLRGTNLDNVAAVLLGTESALRLTVHNSKKISFVMGTAPDFQPGIVPISLVAASTGQSVATPLTFTYTVISKRDREMDYAFDNWNNRTADRYFYIAGTNCANFANQVLRARGWKTNADWHNAGWSDYTRSWVSSTALRSYLAARPNLAVKLTDKQRDQVEVGDVVQFDWDRTGGGDRDHTGIVSRVVRETDGSISIYYVAHTNHTKYSNVDWSIDKQHPGARVFYWSLQS